jgi:glycolate oxidase iron-sulfur subunit
MGAFDSHRTPQRSIVEDCVHCGFCLDACPTYRLWANEADSPRGRIVLIGDALSGPGTLSDETVTHIDRCLGCMACVTACPSGVRYDRLIERVRPQVERHHARRGSERALRALLFATLPHPRRLRALAPLLAATRPLAGGRLPGRLGTLAAIAPRTPLRRVLAGRQPPLTPAAGRRRGRVALLLGCVQRVFYPEVHRATIGALAAEGFDVLAPPAPDCCGALQLHAGEEEAAVARARATIAAFGSLGELDHIVTSAAGCGSAMKGYGELLETDEARAFSARVRDVSELLASLEPLAPRGRLPLRVAYHDACHLRHAQGMLVVASEPDICCGSAGVYNVLEAHAAAQLGARKARALIDTGAELVAAANPGCAAQLDLHLRALGHPLPVAHPVELLWRSIRAGAR